jgi:urease accessory protein
MNADFSALAHLLQLASPALPVGAYSYSEGLELLVHEGRITDALSLECWLSQELQWGAMRLEAATVARVYDATSGITTGQSTAVADWNQWLSALRETEELREQSWQMGRSLVRLLLDLDPTLAPSLRGCGEPCNFAVAFGVAAAHWQIDRQAALTGYLYSWASNLVHAGVRLVPLGQTAGQKVLLNLYPALDQAVTAALSLPDADLKSCGWGLAIASMNHEVMYSRMFRS